MSNMSIHRCLRQQKFFLTICLAAVAVCSPAYADRSEIWAASEIQLILSPETDPGLAWHDIIPDRFRLYTELQEGPTFPDMHQMLWRVGPIWDLAPFFSVATHFTNIAIQDLDDRQFIEEHRFELEPTFNGKFFPWMNWNNRQRLEYRVRADGNRWRYRNRVGLSFPIPETPFSPFVSSELFVGLNGEGLTQNRNTLGLSWQVNPSIRLSASYMLRLVQEPTGWQPIHVAFLSLGYVSQESGILQTSAD